MDCLRFTAAGRLPARVRASGSKNAALPIMAASMLADGPIVLAGVPDLVDVTTLVLLLGNLGVEVSAAPDGAVLHLETVDARPFPADYELVRRMRASFCVLGPLLARRGRAWCRCPADATSATGRSICTWRACGPWAPKFASSAVTSWPRPADCAAPTIDLRGPLGPHCHRHGQRDGAARWRRANDDNRGRPASRRSSTSATSSTPLEPQIVGLGHATRSRSKASTRLGGAAHRVIPDRIEAATLMIAAAITGGRLRSSDVEPEHMTAVLDELAAIGVDVDLRPRQESPCTPAAGRGRSIDRPALSGHSHRRAGPVMALLAWPTGRSVDHRRGFSRPLPARGRAEPAGRADRAAAARWPSIAGRAPTDRRRGDGQRPAGQRRAGVGGPGRRGTKPSSDSIDHLDRGYERLDHKLRTVGRQVDGRGSVTRTTRRADADEPELAAAAIKLAPAADR